MQSEEIRQRFLSFFEKRGHAVIPSASLVPENDPSVLFTTAGMQPLVPYLLGEEHPKGRRLVNVQKCVRTGDLDEVGDNRHFTFFEMLGNWSLGDYFKEDAIRWSYDFLTSETEGLGLDASRLYVTVFEGNADAPFDEESKRVWMSLGIPEHRIYKLGAKDNWWSAGENGPCGPDTEMFYDMTEEGLGELSLEDFINASEREDVIEIWNDVFMEYLKQDGKVVSKLSKQNVDTGAGLERMTAVLQGKQTAYETDLFEPIMRRIKSISSVSDLRAERVVADHIRAAVFMIADGVTPSNTDRGYILRRLLRRAVRYADLLGIREGELFNVADSVISKYRSIYSELEDKSERVINEIRSEEGKFRKTLKDGLKQFEKGTDPFVLFTTYGFPFELTQELARENGVELNESDFKKKFEEHQEKSRAGAGEKFKGGLADTSEEVVKLHTATHLLHQALHDVLGDEISQRGSNITSERLRFDFSFPRKLTEEEKSEVERIVNGKITQALSVKQIMLPKADAERIGAHHFFDQKYPDEVSVYYIGETLEGAYSKEFCGGPHVDNISVLGTFKIIKEEAVSAGVRRIKAILTP
jgi:alanyl-tRNA synthetase